QRGRDARQELDEARVHHDGGHAEAFEEAFGLFLPPLPPHRLGRRRRGRLGRGDRPGDRDGNRNGLRLGGRVVGGGGRGHGRHRDRGRDRERGRGLGRGRERGRGRGYDRRRDRGRGRCRCRGRRSGRQRDTCLTPRTTDGLAEQVVGRLEDGRALR